MCGRTTSTVPRDTLARLLSVDEVDTEELPTSWNVAPTQPVYGVAVSSSGTRELRAMRWGLVPSWAHDPRIGSRLINARAETLDERPAFRTLLARRRALLPFSGFYEWRRSGNERVGRSQPHYFCRSDGQPLVFAGLWDIWRDAEGQPLRSCTIITTTANALVASLHSRMPVVLPESSWDEWLRAEPPSQDELRRLFAPTPDGVLTSWLVGLAVNNARVNRPELTLPAAEQPEALTFADIAIPEL